MGLRGIGIEFEREDWGGGFRSTSDPDFRAINPVGLIPVIEDEGATVWESNTIVRYLAASRGRSDLYPVAALERARVEMWMGWQASDFNNSWRGVFQGLVRKHPDYDQPIVIQSSMAEFSRMVSIVEERLAQTRAYITRSALLPSPT